MLGRSQIFVDRSFLLFSTSIKRIKDIFIGEKDGLLRITKAKTDDGMDNMPSMDSSAMMGPLKNTVVMMITQVVMMGWLNSMFNGFVVLKLPFPLSYRFRLMTQQGLTGMDLDITYVSSLSWYLIIFACFSYVLRLFSSTEKMELGLVGATPSAQNKGGFPSIDGVGGNFGKFSSMVTSVEEIRVESPLLDNIENDVVIDLGIKSSVNATSNDKKLVRKPKRD